VSWPLLWPGSLFWPRRAAGAAARSHLRRADSNRDSSTGTPHANPARPDDHRYQLDHAATHGCPVL